MKLGRLLASGRDDDIFEYGPNSVLRRSRVSRSLELEARTMDYLAAHGYPVPAVEDLIDDGRCLVPRVSCPTRACDNEFLVSAERY
jgi:hypothetical protein